MNTNIDMNGGYLGGEEVIKCYQGNTVVWEQSSGSPIDYSTMPLTFEILSDGNITWKANNGPARKTIEYSLNDGEWISIISTTGAGTSISVVSGDTIQFRGNNFANQNSYQTLVGGTASFKMYGNIMSLVNSTNFSGLTTLSNSYIFKNLFSNCTGLTDASNLILPATALTNQGYYQMFANCTNLTQAPSVLPATTLAGSCYYRMFQSCTALTTAPELPATTLAGNCYEYMFYNCSNLNYIKCLATNISATNCTSNWVQGVAASGTFITPSTTNWSTGYNGIPSGWRRVNSDIPQYTQLEYIQTNFEYFNTQIVPNSNIKVVLDFELTSFDGGYGNNGIFGSWTNGYDGSDTLAFFANSVRSEFSYYCGGGYEDFAGAYTLGNRYTVELDGTECVITEDGGVPQQYVIGLTVSQGTTPILLGCVYPNPNDNPEPTNIKIYEGWIYNGNTLIAHYLPYYDNYNNCNVLKDAVSNTYLSPWTNTPTV